MSKTTRPELLTVDIEEPEAADGRLTGGKGKGLADLVQALGSDAVPYARIVTTEFSRRLLNDGLVTGLVKKLDQQLNDGNAEKAEALAQRIRHEIENLTLPPELAGALGGTVRDIRNTVSRDRIAVRSSGVVEDLPGAAFAGQYETFLNVSLDSNIAPYVLKCVASAFGWRVIDYRQNLRRKGKLHKSEHDLMKEGMIAVVLQTMVDAEKSGVAFSIDPDTGNRNVGVIQATYGLGEILVQGKENASWTAFSKSPDVRVLGTEPPDEPQKTKIVYDPETDSNKTVDVGLRDPRVVTKEEASKLAEYVAQIENEFGHAVDVEFAIEDGRVFITQARPESVHSVRATIDLYRVTEEPDQEPIYRGIPVGKKIASGEATTASDHMEARRKVDEYNEQGVNPMLITSMTTPDWEVVMTLDKVSAIITERGSRTSHAAIVSRERGIPCAVGVEGVSDLDDGTRITLDCSGGEAVIYEGEIPFEVEKIEVEEIPETKTRVMVNIGSPDQALNVSQLPSQGSSLVRVEFIVSNTELHPVFAIRADELGHDRWADDIKEFFPTLTSLTDEYVERLKTGVAVIAAAFHPRDAIVRFSDFKTNEYASLPGAVYYEYECQCGDSISLEEYSSCPICGREDAASERVELEFTERNPMLGFRGASRYVHDMFRDAFELELQAFTMVHELELRNAIPMIPFVRTLQEARQVHRLIVEAFEEASLDIPEIFLMGEVPSNCLISREFSEHCDGFSIGSNDLTQFTLGIDRDQELLAEEFNEGDPAVRKAISMLCEGAHSMNPPRKVGICGQAPSDLGREFIRFLTIHLDSIGVNPDKVLETILMVDEIEDQIEDTLNEADYEQARVAQELAISETNAGYLISKIHGKMA